MAFGIGKRLFRTTNHSSCTNQSKTQIEGWIRDRTLPLQHYLTLHKENPEAPQVQQFHMKRKKSAGYQAAGSNLMDFFEQQQRQQQHQHEFGDNHRALTMDKFKRPMPSRRVDSESIMDMSPLKINNNPPSEPPLHIALRHLVRNNTPESCCIVLSQIRSLLQADGDPNELCPCFFHSKPSLPQIYFQSHSRYPSKATEMDHTPSCLTSTLSIVLHLGNHSFGPRIVTPLLRQDLKLTISALLAAGANVRLNDGCATHGWSILRLALSFLPYEVVQTILERGARVDKGLAKDPQLFNYCQGILREWRWRRTRYYEEGALGIACERNPGWKDIQPLTHSRAVISKIGGKETTMASENMNIPPMLPEESPSQVSQLGEHQGQPQPRQVSSGSGREKRPISGIPTTKPVKGQSHPGTPTTNTATTASYALSSSQGSTNSDEDPFGMPARTSSSTFGVSSSAATGPSTPSLATASSSGSLAVSGREKPDCMLLNVVHWADLNYGDRVLARAWPIEEIIEKRG